MDASRELPNASKDMYSTGRRSAISTSELGLYSDYSDHYKSDKNGKIVRKFVIGIMVVVSVILIGIFLYDFASSASISSKVSQETKHIYILQNSLRKGLIPSKKPTTVTYPPTIYIVNTSNATLLEDRSDNADDVEFRDSETEKPSSSTSTELAPNEQRMSDDEPELRVQNLKNFKLRNSLLSRRRQHSDVFDNHMIHNHAMNHRVSKYKFPGADEDDEDDSDEDNRRAVPFRFELKGPHPASFKRQRYPQLAQYRYPHASRNIQDIIKYLTNNPESLNRGFKFTGFYVNPKKYDSHTDIGVVATSGDDASEEQESSPYAMSTDPLYRYKPKHPTDVNLLATSNFRFSPVGLQRYNPYYDTYYQKPSGPKDSHYHESPYESAGAYSAVSHGKKRKPKPFSVMLDIYPIAESSDQSPKASRLKPRIMMDEPDSRRSHYPPSSRHPKHLYGSTIHGPPHQASEEEDDSKHQMILHLNLYPKKKSKHTRNEIIDRSQHAADAEKEQLINRMMLPFDAIAKRLADHAAAEGAKLHEEFPSKVRYEESLLAKEEANHEVQADELLSTTTISNDSKDVIYVTTTAAPETATNTMATVGNASTTTSTQTIIIVEDTTTKKNYSSNDTDIDTVEGFQQFADSLIAMD